ncbi:amidohydrolase family protein [Thiotrichales bacterium 19S3-7]|nr:amidohydrolase family protein [Thiotrichales bacterium 19S3-7]MCF6800992.1 amidohydrolase family protein [Thiotrichales bacterium 19S3-11]
MNIIDSHIHLWDIKNNYNQWIFSSDTFKAIQQSFTLDSVKASLNHALKGIVHIEAHDSKTDTLKETQWLINEAQKHPDIELKIIAFADILQPTNHFKQSIERLLTYPEIIGIRHILAHQPSANYNPLEFDETNNPNLIKNLQLLAEYNLIFEAQFYPKQWLKLAPYLEKFTTKIMLEHFGLPIMDHDSEFHRWAKAIKSLKSIESVYVKVSGLTMFKAGFTLDELDNLLSYLIETIGTERLVYGSNFPVDYNQNYSNWFNQLNQANLTEQQKQKLFFDNANAFYEFNLK